MKEFAGPPRPPRERWTPRWFRFYTGCPSHPKWRAVACRLGLPVHQVLATAVFLMDCANKGRPRGSLAELSFAECAAVLDLDSETVGRIYAAFGEFGWVDQDYIVTWDERQPDLEDPTARERQQRRRAKLRDERIVTVSRVTPVTVTTRGDQEVRRLPGKEAVQSGDNSPNNQAATGAYDQTQRPLPLPPVMLRGGRRG